MPGRWTWRLTILFGLLPAFVNAPTRAEDRIALKNGESADIGSAYFVSHCRSILLEPPQVEVLDGPPQLVLTIRQDMVVPRRYNCPNKVAGGVLTMTAKDVTEPIQSQLTYRVKYKTKDGDRQTSHLLNVSLFP